MRHYKLFLQDILTAMGAVQEFIKDIDFDSFVIDDKTSSAVVHKLVIIGEAANKLPDTILQQYPHIPWRKMVGMRNWIVHAYFEIDYPVVWETVKDLIPQLQPIIAQILEDMENEQDNE